MIDALVTHFQSEKLKQESEVGCKSLHEKYSVRREDRMQAVSPA